MNPYLPHDPIQDRELLFGREDELHELAAFLRGGQSVAVVGPRKIGKTSLLRVLTQPAAWAELGIAGDILLAYLDCATLGYGAHDMIYGRFAAEIGAALSRRGLPAEPAVLEAASQPSRLAFEAGLRRLDQRGLRVALILDAFEHISANPQLQLGFFNALRSAATRYQLVFLTASARPLIDLTYAGTAEEIRSSPFFNIFAQISLGLLSEPAAGALIRGPARSAGVTLTPSLEAWLYELAGGQPHALQVACAHAFMLGDDRAEIQRRTYQDLAPHFAAEWRELTPAARRALWQLANAEAQDALALRELERKCLLVMDQGRYCAVSRAWAQFVAAQHD
jgi:hypothetical protein